MSSLDHFALPEVTPAPFFGDAHAAIIAHTWGNPAEARKAEHPVPEGVQAGADLRQNVSETADRMVASLAANGDFGQFESEIQKLVKGVNIPDLDGILNQLHTDLSKRLLESDSPWRINKIQYTSDLDIFRTQHLQYNLQ